VDSDRPVCGIIEWNGAKGDKCLMEFLVVSLVEWFQILESYGI